MLMADTPRTVSLRAGLLLRLGIVLVLLLALDAVASYFTALHFANLVYDRWLIDSTRSLAQAVRAEHGLVHFDVPHVALRDFPVRRSRQDLLQGLLRERGFHQR